MRAGAASVVITPREPMWLAGWAARREPASGKAMDLFAKVLALEDSDGRRLIIVTADLIAIPRELATAVAARCGVPRECILFNASHTHCGPEVRLDKVPFFEIPAEYAAKIPAYVKSLEEKMTEAIATALLKLEPVLLQVSQARIDFARNRRTAEGTVDHDVPILQISRLEEPLLAVVFGYACHNLTLPPSVCQYHGDYAGVAQQTLEKALPGTVALFLAGAGADQNPAPTGDHGQSLAEAVENCLTQPARTIEDSLQAVFEEIPLDFLPLPSAETLKTDLASDDNPRARKAKYLIDSQLAGQTFPVAYPCPVQVFRLGKELLLIALGGEPVVDYALQLKAKFHGPLVWVAGYSNDMFGYLPTRRIQNEGGYEGGRALLWSALPAPFTETVETRILSAVQRLVNTL